MIFSALLLAICLIVFVWKLLDLRREPHNLASWGTAVVMLCIGATVVFRQPGVTEWLKEVAGPNVATLARNLTLVGALAALQLFYLNGIASFLRQTRIRVEIGLIVTVVAALVIIERTTPLAVTIVPTDRALQNPHVIAFYLFAGGYVLYALCVQLWWLSRYSRRFQQRWLRATTVVTACGTVFLLVSEATRLTSQIASALEIGRIPRWVLYIEVICTRVGIPLLLIGLLLPVVVSGVRRLISLAGTWQRYRRLAALDRAVGWALPELVRPPAPREGRSPDSSATGRPQFGPRPGIRFAYQERLQLCRDGYTRLSPYLGDTRVSDDTRVARLVTELQACAPSPPANDGHVDDDHLVAVSVHLRARGNRWMTEQLSTNPQSA